MWIAFDLFLQQAGEQLAGIRWLRLAQLHCSIVHQVSIIFNQILLFSSLALCHCQHLDLWYLFVLQDSNVGHALRFVQVLGFTTRSGQKSCVDDRVLKSVRTLTHLICLLTFDICTSLAVKAGLVSKKQHWRPHKNTYVLWIPDMSSLVFAVMIFVVRKVAELLINPAFPYKHNIGADYLGRALNILVFSDEGKGIYTQVISIHR